MTTIKHKNPKKISRGYEPIPGYVLEEMIGRGGFGEVWRSSAPGGLKKAVKFVFGAQDQSRATRELRSLERIKGVRHPFLLTLERFEIVDDQLVIITELAEESLEEVFKRYRDNGSCGIPREGLLSYLHDTADALDYLHQSYQLQHLDIKPGNLLLIGDHVKVADFGLLKDLRDVECSIVGGLTPIYAPPEVFDGRPSLSSDQYSLAVMYQELLTGTRPFSGRTIAQLATQHVHSAPNLEPLPARDRPVMARALEKNPERRFPSCKAFVEALRNVRGRTSTGSRGSELTQEDTNAEFDGVHSATPVEDLPQLSTGTSKQKATATDHALVIALGGTGAECVLELRRRVANLRSACNLNLHSVVIDTDMSTIHSMRIGEASERVTKCNVIYTPLKSAKEYRANGTDRLRTISRRWIYNVPRSGATGGMRPLGRLALVDHGVAVTEKLTQAVQSLSAEANTQTPSVYVVGSLAGGTGSGMYIDVVHLLRHLLDQVGLEEAKILSMLTAAPFQADPSNPLALHDTQAAIKEIEHFLQAGNGYPGDVGAGWPSVPAARTPLRDIYVVSSSMQNRLAPSPIETIAEYVWADASACGDLLAAARKQEEADSISIESPSFRSVGVVPLSDGHRLEQKLLVPAVVREMLMVWLGLPSKARLAAAALSDRLVRRIGLSEQNVVETIVDHIGSDENRCQLAELTRSIPPGSDDIVESITAAIEPWIDQKLIHGDLDWISAGWINNLYREISVCLNDRRADLTTVIKCLEMLREQSRTIASQLPRESTQLPDVVTRSRADFAIEMAANRFAVVQLENFGTSLKFLEERLERFAAVLAVAIVETKSELGDSNPWDEMTPDERSQFDPLVSSLHNQSVSEHLVRPLNDLGANVEPKTLVRSLSAVAMPLVISVIEKHGNELAEREPIHEQSMAKLITVPNSSSSMPLADVTQTLPTPRSPWFTEGPMSIEDAVIAVTPSLLAMGGLQRLILVVNNEVERSQFEPALRAVHDGAVTVAIDSGSDAKLIHEAQQIELKNILSRLTVLNGGNAQITGRLASRTDVNW